MVARTELPFERQLQHALGAVGIDINPMPHHGQKPHPTLIRGENSRDRVTGKDRYFHPHAGQMGTRGVFLADVLFSVMDSDIYYVFHEREVLRASGSNAWIPYGGREGEKSAALLEAIAKRKGLDLHTIGGGIEAEAELFTQWPIYQPHTGIATIPKPLPVAMAHTILVKESVMRELGGRISKPLADKIVRF